MNKYEKQVVDDLARLCGIPQEQAESHLEEIKQLFAGGFSRSEIVAQLKKEYSE